MVFSTSLGPRPGRQRADDQHRRRELGEGVDAHARRDDARRRPRAPMQSIRIAIGLRSERPGHRAARARRRGVRTRPRGASFGARSTRSPSSRSARPSVTTSDAGRERGVDEQAAAGLALAPRRCARGRRRPRRRRRVAFVAAHRRPRRAGSRSRAPARRRRCGPRRWCRPGCRGSGSGGRSRSGRCGSRDRRRARGGRWSPARSCLVAETWICTLRARRERRRSRSRARRPSGARCSRSTTETIGVPGAHEGARIDRRAARPRRRRARAGCSR